jgi:hypothetical protein
MYMDERRDLEDSTLVPFDEVEREYSAGRELPRTDVPGFTIPASEIAFPPIPFPISIPLPRVGLPDVKVPPQLRLNAELRTFHSKRGRRSRLKAIYDAPPPKIAPPLARNSTYLTKTDRVITGLEK